ncbi:MAG: imidazolonepropionase [Rhizobiales bacterium]|nr:imidazolonepropionase [Hyphomicrobiales bacterium]MBP9175242.1 imidazolonepropionase [Hyphomicrobiales bacterium]
MVGGYGLVEKGAVLIENGIIKSIGPDTTKAASIDCGGRLLTPGLIDCHTHLVYGGNRAAEFEQRLNGASYADIAKAGGGIMSTVHATRAASEAELLESALRRLESLLAEGVTTIEIKSGYGLDVETEVKMLKVARKLGNLRPVDVKTTYLGAHTFPKEFRENHEAYLKIVCDQALPRVAGEGLADAVDAFCEGIAFSVEETRTVFKAARAHNLPVKLHAEQLSNLGGAKMAAGFKALSVDHIEYLDEEGVESISKSGTVAVLLPGAFYYLREKRAPPVASLRRHKVPIAIATDLNPGSSPVHSLLATMNMACVLFGLTPEEALLGVTANAARALDLKDRGTIAVGQKADLALWDVKRPGDLAYPLGFNPLAALIRNGELIRGTLP